MLAPVHTKPFIRFGSLRIFDLTYVENRGAMFGFMAGRGWFLIGITAILMCLLGYFCYSAYKKSAYLTIAAILCFAGGVGNLIDRIFRGFVVDMFEVKLFEFAVFNVADICVTIAMVMFIIYVFITEPLAEKRKAKNENS